MKERIKLIAPPIGARKGEKSGRQEIDLVEKTCDKNRNGLQLRSMLQILG